MVVDSAVLSHEPAKQRRESDQPQDPAAQPFTDFAANPDLVLKADGF